MSKKEVKLTTKILKIWKSLSEVREVIDKLAHGRVKGVTKLVWSFAIQGKKIQNILIKIDSILDKIDAFEENIIGAKEELDTFKLTIKDLKIEGKGILGKLIIKLLGGKTKLENTKSDVVEKIDNIVDLIKEIEKDGES